MFFFNIFILVWLKSLQVKLNDTGICLKTLWLTQRVNCKVNYGLWVITCQCRFISCKKCMEMLIIRKAMHGWGHRIYGKSVYLLSWTWNFSKKMKSILKNITTILVGGGNGWQQRWNKNDYGLIIVDAGWWVRGFQYTIF